ncbi:MAG: EAL domain-containing protein [Gammaproteobacteria bacterium]|nr:EAL domain-containing protein [Gammaproteobacteria bacterium]
MVKHTDAIPLIVIADLQDQVEALNKSIRSAGRPVHCSWITDINELGDGLDQINPELIVVFLAEIDNRLKAVIKIRDRFASRIPVIVCCRSVDEESIASAMKTGAQDMVSLEHPGRLQSVIARELRAFRLERALNKAGQTVRDYKNQLTAALRSSADAIAVVREGIITKVNPAWLEQFGRASEQELLGQPFLDSFDRSSHITLKGALIACALGRLQLDLISATALISDGSSLMLDLKLEESASNADSDVIITIAADHDVNRAPEQKLKRALHLDPATGLYQRMHFLKRLSATVKNEPKSGVRALIYLKPDQFGSITQEIGPLATEGILVQMAGLLKELTQPGDLYGRFGGNIFCALLARGNSRDIDAWVKNLIQRMGEHTYIAGNRSISLTVTIGMVPPEALSSDAGELLKHAESANAKGRKKGGNCLSVMEISSTDTRVQAYDKNWVKRIKSALIQNRFRLLHQPIANLGGEEQAIFDLLVRMIDEENNVILPNDFLPAAQRNNLMKPIDRWVIGAALSFCQSRNPDQVFVRLSSDSLVDLSLIDWLGKQLAEQEVAADKLVFQVTESDVAQQVKPSIRLAKQLDSLGCGLALEHFGAGRNSTELLKRLPVKYAKIDGSLMQGIAGNSNLQDKVRELVRAAHDSRVLTIAEQVQDANTMATLWQLGVEYMQGYYVQEPNVVLADDPNANDTTQE